MQKLWIKIFLSIALLSWVVLLAAQDNKGKFMLGTAQYFKQTKKPNLPTYNISTKRTWESRYSFSYFVKNLFAIGILAQHEFEKNQNYNNPTNGLYSNYSLESFYFALQANWFLLSKKKLKISLNQSIGYSFTSRNSHFQNTSVIYYRYNPYRENKDGLVQASLYPTLHINLKPSWDISLSTLHITYSLGDISTDLSLNLLFGVNYYF